jgi:hypothetical protein
VVSPEFSSPISQSTVHRKFNHVRSKKSPVFAKHLTTSLSMLVVEGILENENEKKGERNQKRN